MKYEISDSAKWQKGFWYLMATQFQNAFSDMTLKTLIVFLVLSSPLSESERSTYVALAGALFAGPFILLSMFGGWCADRFSKQKVMQSVKLAELGIMLFATLSLYLQNLHLQLCALFLMGSHSAIFGPSKYGILPEILPFSRLSWGNGVIELLTFLGIIGGTIAGGLLAQHLQGVHFVSGYLLLILACIGVMLSKGIPHVTAANPSTPLRLDPVTNLLAQLKVMRKDVDLWRANWGNAGFWFVATLVQMNLTIYAKEILKLTEQQNGLLNAALAIGIGVGSVIAGYVSKGRIAYGLIPIGAIGMAIASLPMGLAGIGVVSFSFCLVALGLFGGLFIVPIAAVLQHNPSPESRGAVQGAASLMSFVGIFAVSGVQIFLISVLGLSAAHVFWICGIIILGMGIRSGATRKVMLSQNS